MKRHLFNILSALSLLLCVASAILWVRSYRWKEGMYCNTSLAYFSSYLRYGSLCCSIHFKPARNLPSLGFYRREQSQRGTNLMDVLLADSPFRAAGFAFGQYRGLRGASPFWYAIIPCWPIALITALPPAAWVARAYRTHRRYTRGLCPTCAYDLRASKDRCPECGSPIPRPTP